MTGALSVWWDGVIAGTLSRDDDGNMVFVYSEAWLADPARPALSFSLPKQAAPFERRRAHPFFAGLLPEEQQKDGAARALGLSKGNDFALLDALGGDVAGALTLWPEDQPPPLYDGATANAPLSDQELADILEILPKRPLLAGEDGLRVSLAGAQAKLPVVLMNGRVALPAKGQPTTHILKPPISTLPLSTENEAFAMRLAKAVGISVADAGPHRIADRTYLLVTRYDRKTTPAGRYRRLHQEDFCQALGIAPEKKYAKEEGPTFKSSFALVRDTCQRPAAEVLKLLDAALFNLLVGNADAHGKNYSLLYAPDGAQLAPLYDLMCTAAYPHIATGMAMKFGNARTLDELRHDTFTKFSADTGLSAPFVRRRAIELADVVGLKAGTVGASIADLGFDRAELQRLTGIVTDRAKRVTVAATTAT